jgi:hypothetical protein
MRIAQAASLVGSIPGSVAFVDASQIPKGLKVLKIDGKASARNFTPDPSGIPGIGASDGTDFQHHQRSSPTIAPVRPIWRTGFGSTTTIARPSVRTDKSDSKEGCRQAATFSSSEVAACGHGDLAAYLKTCAGYLSNTSSTVITVRSCSIA